MLLHSNNAHLTNDEPTRYGYGKARLAKFEAKEAAGDSWYCDYIKSDGKKCKIARVKVEGATKCYQHLGRGNPVQNNDGYKEEEQQDRDESPQTNQGVDKKRSCDENSEGDSSRKHLRITKAKCTGKKKDGHDCTFQAQLGTEKCGIHAKTS